MGRAVHPPSRDFEGFGATGPSKSHPIPAIIPSISHLLTTHPVLPKNSDTRARWSPKQASFLIKMREIRGWIRARAGQPARLPSDRARHPEVRGGGEHQGASPATGPRGGSTGSGRHGSRCGIRSIQAEGWRFEAGACRRMASSFELGGWRLEVERTIVGRSLLPLSPEATPSCHKTHPSQEPKPSSERVSPRARSQRFCEKGIPRARRPKILQEGDPSSEKPKTLQEGVYPSCSRGPLLAPGVRFPDPSCPRPPRSQYRLLGRGTPFSVYSPGVPFLLQGQGGQARAGASRREQARAGASRREQA
jgi:hypothetical protein